MKSLSEFFEVPEGVEFQLKGYSTIYKIENNILFSRIFDDDFELSYDRLYFFKDAETIIIPQDLGEYQTNWKKDTRQRLISIYKGSFFNERDEFIAHKYSNTYFIFGNCKSLEEVNCKVLEWFSRPAYKGVPYLQEWRNVKFRKFMLDGINRFLNTNFTDYDVETIYEYLGNACNHKRTLEFVRSGYDMKMFKSL